MKLTRYEPDLEGGYGGTGPYPGCSKSEDGEYVRYEDAQQQIDLLRSALTTLLDFPSDVGTARAALRATDPHKP